MLHRGSSFSAFANFLQRQRVMVLDGGLATTLETLGLDISSELWSAEVLLQAPNAIKRVHGEFLAAGADCITSCSYQASIEGFRNRGISSDGAADLLRLSVKLAMDARTAFWGIARNRDRRQFPVVAASVGPYGAYLADGTEYTGRYDIGVDQLYEFHRERWHVLATSGADLLACETIPSSQEAEVYLRLLHETPGVSAWLTFSCRDGRHLADGTPIADVARACRGVPNVVAVGVNCIPPELVAELLDELRCVTDTPLLAYPNSGERYDAVGRTWAQGLSSPDWDRMPSMWQALGAVGIGGCCRVGPADIACLRKALNPG